MSQYTSIFLAGALLGAFVGFTAMGLIKMFIGPESISERKNLRAECEINLPRNQNCVLQYVPEGKKQ